MIIQKKVYDQLIKCLPEYPPEMGGMLGGTDNVIKIIEFDYGQLEHLCGYEPDVHRLNAEIKVWLEKDIYFMGIFHTHFFGVKTLSEPDIEYIKQILNAMPEYISKLYFPIAVLPERKLIPYIAIRQEPDVLIKADKLIIQ